MTRAGDRSLVVAVLTYRRPDDLGAILPLLIDQVERVDLPASVLVVDNDAAGTGAAAASALENPLVRAVVEPRPGIAAARNRALAEADADLLVFIDDDERPSEDWLALLLATYRCDRPAGVVGPVVSEFESEPDPWIKAGRFFDRKRHPTGTLVDVAATNNLLLDLRRIRAMDLRFDERFGITGGSDTLFTRQLVAGAGPLVWCDEAVVVDKVPSSRVTRRWVLRRAYRFGNGWSRTSIALTSGWSGRLRTRVWLTGVGVARVLVGGIRWVVGTLSRSTSSRAQGTRTCVRGLGMLTGAWGIVFAEYSRPANAAP